MITTFMGQCRTRAVHSSSPAPVRGIETIIMAMAWRAERRNTTEDTTPATQHSNAPRGQWRTRRVTSATQTRTQGGEHASRSPHSQNPHHCKSYPRAHCAPLWKPLPPHVCLPVCLSARLPVCPYSAACKPDSASPAGPAGRLLKQTRINVRTVMPPHCGVRACVCEQSHYEYT